MARSVPRLGWGIDRGSQAALKGAIMNAEKLVKVCELLGKLRTTLDGGWYYSTPLLRTHDAVPVEWSDIWQSKPDALSIVAEVVADLDRISATLHELTAQAAELQIDTVQVCGADLGLLARVYTQLAQDVSASANKAVEALRPPPAPRRGRKPNAPDLSALVGPEKTDGPGSQVEMSPMVSHESEAQS
jgi:hypothetical protein